MKCQNCGKDEVCFHFSSSIDGIVTQTNLCAECASASGYNFGNIFKSGGLINTFSPMFSSQLTGASYIDGGFFPLTSSIPWFKLGFPHSPQQYRISNDEKSECECGAGCGKIAPDTAEAEVDIEMMKRREINMAREQMRMAAENDDFEKAIELREKIKEMEAQ